jgi:DNA-directed RNA polymerase specialized sigma24 family protein
MSQTFEELATNEIDGLYQGALFLAAGDEVEAEQLLIETLGRSFSRFHAGDATDDIRRWLEGKMVSTFMESHSRDVTPTHHGPGAVRLQASHESAFASLDAQGLHSAAAEVPWAARAALWLVLLRRWKYDDASDAMGIGRPILKNLLEYRHTLVGAILGGRRRRDRGQHAAGT